jgi:hypothetical protein
MSGINYEIQNRKLQSYKHTFDYNFCKRKYDEYAFMTLDEFRECLKDTKKTRRNRAFMLFCSMGEK